MESKGLNYPEINEIQNFISNNQVFIHTIHDELIDEKLTPMVLEMRKVKYIIQVMDEYQDLNFNNKLLNYVIVFRELELIQETIDFLDWCKQLGLKANNDKLRNYYKDIADAIPKIKEYFINKDLTSFISDIDFQLNSGAIQFLRKQ